MQRTGICAVVRTRRTRRSRRAWAVLAAAALGLCCVHDAGAATRSWTGGQIGVNTAWNDANDWSPFGVPAAGDAVVVPGLLSLQDTLVTYNYTGPAITLSSLTLNHGNNHTFDSSVLNMSANTLSSSAEYLGDSTNGGNAGRGVINQSGGSNTTPLLELGRLAGNIGAYNLSGGTLNAAQLRVGDAGAGFFTQTGGRLNGTSMSVGTSSGSRGTYGISAGIATFTGGATIGGGGGAGTLNVSGGGQLLQWSDTNCILADAAVANVSGSGSIWDSGKLFVGSGGAASVTISSGGHVASDSGNIGYYGNSVGSVLVTGPGSAWTMSGGLWVGGVTSTTLTGGTGTLTIDGGASVTSGGAILAYSNGSSAAVSVSGAGSSWTTGELTIGQFGSATLTIDPGATVSVTGNFYDYAGLVQLRGGTFDAGSFNPNGGTFDWQSGRLSFQNYNGSLVQSVGTLAPRHPSGVTSVITGGYTQQAGGTLETEIGGPPGANGGLADANDFLRIAGPTTLAGALQLKLLNGYVPQPRDAFVLVQPNGGLTGTFASIVGYAIGPGQDFAIDYASGGIIARAGEWHDAQLNGIVDVPGTKLDVTGNVAWSTTLTKQGAGSLIVDLTGGSSTASPGSLLKVLAGNVVLKSNVGATSGNLGMQLVGGDAYMNANERVASLDVADGRLAMFNANGARVLTVGSLALHASGKLDLSDNNLVVDYTGASPIGTIRSYIQQAYSSGSWTGAGLTSSAAQAASASAHRTALGYGEASTVLGTGGGTFAGQSVDGDSVLVRYTFYGDSNLDRKVDLTDFTYLAANFNGTSKTWLQGDYNYDGSVDLTDFTFLASNFNQSLPADGGSLGSSIPEPVGAALIFLALTGIGRRRHRRSATHTRSKKAGAR